MVWAKVDDRLHSSAKWRAASKGARALWTTALSWCADQETDGHVPAGMLSVLDGTANDAKSLVAAGLWQKVPDGWLFHKWSEYQPVRSQLEERREKERLRLAEKRAKRADVASNTGATREGVGAVLNTPTRPDPTTTSNEVVDPPTPQGGKRAKTKGTRLVADWMPSAELIAQMRAECPQVDLQAEHRIFVDYWIAQPGQKGVKLDWPATWRNWMRRKQGDASRGAPKTFGQQKQENTLALVERLREEEGRAAVGSGDAPGVRALGAGW